MRIITKSAHAALALFVCSAAFGQADKGRISGTVIDSTGALIPGAFITVKNEKTGETTKWKANESGNFVVEKEPVRIAGVLKRAVRSLQQVASRDEIFLMSAHGRDVPQVIGSVEKLTQAVINLVSNSLKFTPKKGLISVGAQIVRSGELPESIVITVTDSGMGIKAEELSQIWEKYKQSGNKSLRGGGGTGLGLYIVKQIIEAHGGEISVASLEGIGTSMVLRLPVKRTGDTGLMTASRVAAG